MMRFEEGNGRLIEGRTFREEDLLENRNAIIISQSVANANNLNIGATFMLESNIRQIELNSFEDMRKYDV